MESTDGSIRRSRSMSHVNHQEHGHNNSDQGDGYASEDLESGSQRRKDPSPLQELDKNLSSSTKNSTSNEGDEEQLSLINEKKQERMTSDKQAARRSRMRKQKHLDELWSQVISLRNENHQLTDTLNATANAGILEQIFVIANFVLELPSAVFDQLSSVHKPQYALVSMITSFAAMLISIIELVFKGREGRVTGRWTGKIPWLYYSGEVNKPFGTFTDIIGFVCAIFQCIFASVTYAFYTHHSDNPIRFSTWPLIFAFGLLCTTFLNKSRRKALSNRF
ncbi:hypothetical protein ACOSQ2_004449 [Xanthoceras sorbifolium]